MVYSNSSLSGKQCVSRLLLLTGTPEARYRWLSQCLGTELEAPVAMLASGEGLVGPNAPNGGLSEQLQRFDEKAKAADWAVTRLSMGCICCSSKLIMSTHLGRMLRLVKPRTLIIELDSQSHSEQVHKMLSEGQWQGWFDSIEVFQAI